MSGARGEARGLIELRLRVPNTDLKVINTNTQKYTHKCTHNCIHINRCHTHTNSHYLGLLLEWYGYVVTKSKKLPLIQINASYYANIPTCIHTFPVHTRMQFANKFIHKLEHITHTHTHTYTDTHTTFAYHLICIPPIVNYI